MKRLIGFVLIAVACGITTLAHAQDYPNNKLCWSCHLRPAARPTRSRAISA